MAKNKASLSTLASGRKLTRSELTHAIQRYARIHGYFCRTVRDVTALRYAAIREYRALWAS